MADDVTPTGQSKSGDTELPKLDGNRVRLVTRVPPSYYTWVNAEAKRRGISTSDVLMDLVDRQRGYVPVTQGVLEVAV